MIEENYSVVPTQNMQYKSTFQICNANILCAVTFNHIEWNANNYGNVTLSDSMSETYSGYWEQYENTDNFIFQTNTGIIHTLN